MLLSDSDTNALSPAAPPVQWLVQLCQQDTTSGQEDRGLAVLSELLGQLGADVQLQEVAAGRTNVLACWGQPRVLFSTHVDTVPPFLPPTIHADRVTGRGTCDAKGQIVAQLAAIQRLRQSGLDGFAWLGVVGEETDSLGAKAAIEWAEQFRACELVINGEPTELKLATGQRGYVRYRLSTQGRAAHSGLPSEGHNALWPLVDWLQSLREEPPASHRLFGKEVWNCIIVEGGRAANVIPDRAVADVTVRTVPGSKWEQRLAELCPPEGSFEEVQRTEPEEFLALPGFAAEPVPFGSDAPRLRKLAPAAAVMMVGPGSIRVAHTDDELLMLAELAAGIELNCRLVRHFMSAKGEEHT